MEPTQERKEQLIPGRSMDRATLQTLMAGPPENFYVVEVTAGETYARAHLPQAILCSVSEISEWASRENIDKSATIVLYSESVESFGARRAARILEELGYRQVFYYPGGKEDWMAADLPVESFYTDISRWEGEGGNPSGPPKEESKK